MDPLTAIALANAAIQVLQVLIPEIEKLANKGQVSVEQQQAVMDKYNTLRAQIIAGGFKGPEFEMSPES